MSGLTLGNVTSMMTCSVLRCQNPGSAVVGGGQYLNRPTQAVVCADHHEQIEAGAPWDVQDGLVLMDQDFAPLLKKWATRSSVGAQGFTLSLETSNSSKPFDVFISPEQAKLLHMLLRTRGGE